MTTLKVIILCLSLLIFAKIHVCVDNEVLNVMSVGNRVILEVGKEYRLYDTRTNNTVDYGSKQLFPGIGLFKPFHATAVTEHPKWPKANDMLIVLAKHSKIEYKYLIYRIVNETYEKVSDNRGLPNWGLNASGFSYMTNEVDPFWGAISDLNAIAFYSNVFISLKSSSANDRYSVCSIAVESDDKIGDWVTSSSNSPNFMVSDVRSLFVISDNLYAFYRNTSKSLRHIMPVRFERINGSIGLKFLENETTDVNEFFSYVFNNSIPFPTETSDKDSKWTLVIVGIVCIAVFVLCIAIGITICLCCRGKKSKSEDSDKSKKETANKKSIEAEKSDEEVDQKNKPEAKDKSGTSGQRGIEVNNRWRFNCTIQ